MPFGLSNAPETFQTMMNELLRPLLQKFVIVFFDDILIYGTTSDSHLQELTQVFNFLEEAIFYLKFSKCLFLKTSIDYLGHIIMSQGIKPNLSKLEPIVQWPIPASKQVWGFWLNKFL